MIWGAEEKTTSGGAVCRDLERRTFINNAYRNGSAVACRSSQGRWDGVVSWRND